MRYFFEISYKGTLYHGWQIQKNAITIQQVVEEGLKLILQEELGITGSGRTDTGVHCRQQFFHVDLQQKFEKDWLLHRINSFLPDDIAIKNIYPVKDDAHARFDAFSRSYEYVIARKKDPFTIETTYLYTKYLNISTMNEAASLLIGKQNFESFSKVKTDVSNFTCDIQNVQWVENGSELIFYITANRFLRGMVRAIVGTLLEIGKENISVTDFKKIIIARDRRKAGAAAPPQGLFLTKVLYPQDIYLND